jgi:hypothetical protein
MTPYDAPKVFPKSAMQTIHKESSNQLAKWAKNNNVYTMNFESLFCGIRSCSRYSKGEWLYRDEDHLSPEGANLTISKFSDFLKEL